MTTPRVPRLDLLRNAEVQDVDCLREATEWLWQPRMEAEVRAPIGAQRYERSAERTTRRAGHRGRDGETRLGPWHRDIPKLRKGSDCPHCLEPRRRREPVLVSVIQEAYVAGVSTRQVDPRVQALGMTGISKSQVYLVKRKSPVWSKKIPQGVGNFLFDEKGPQGRGLRGLWHHKGGHHPSGR